MWGLDWKISPMEWDDFPEPAMGRLGLNGLPEGASLRYPEPIRSVGNSVFGVGLLTPTSKGIMCFGWILWPFVWIESILMRSNLLRCPLGVMRRSINFF